jgi:uroporphyrinogen-III synthase
MNRAAPDLKGSPVPGSPEGFGAVVTRPEKRDGPLSTLLEKRGATVFLWPTFSIESPEDLESINDFLGDLTGYNWIVFASPRAVEAVSAITQPPPAESSGGLRIAAVGGSTARALEENGWPVHFIPESYSGEALVKEFGERDWARGAKILFPAGSIARETIPEGLRQLGAHLDQVTVYVNKPAELDQQLCLQQIENGEIDVVTFASPSAVESLQFSLKESGFHLLKRSSEAVAIGPTTARALEETGWPPAATADPSTLEGLAEAAVIAITNRG